VRGTRLSTVSGGLHPAGEGWLCSSALGSKERREEQKLWARRKTQGGERAL